MSQPGNHIFETALGDRMDYQHAFGEGLGVSEFDPKSKAASEMQELTQELLTIITKN
ncbi:MAG: hypothetical protein HC842_00530 [Cytophagales bacterium]|nr:hypothetical protein [Cytophagales bacterium]